MNKISESSKEIYDLLGSCYGFNGTEDHAIKLLEEKITEVAKYYADKAFVSGRSQTPWKVFYVNNFLSGDTSDFTIAKQAEIWRIESERLKSELLHRDINIIPEKDAEYEVLKRLTLQIIKDLFLIVRRYEKDHQGLYEWEEECYYKAKTFLSENDVLTSKTPFKHERIAEIGLLCDGKEYCQCSKEAMSRGANRDIVESYERNCPNQPH